MQYLFAVFHSFPSYLNNTYWSSYFFLLSDFISLIPQPVYPCPPQLPLLQGPLLFLLCHYHYNNRVLFLELAFSLFTQLRPVMQWCVCKGFLRLVQNLLLSITFSASLKFHMSFKLCQNVSFVIDFQDYSYEHVLMGFPCMQDNIICHCLPNCCCHHHFTSTTCAVTAQVVLVKWFVVKGDLITTTNHCCTSF